MDFPFEWLLDGFPSGWIIDVWNCRGTLKPYSKGGYGKKYKLEKGLVWYELEYFTIPIVAREKEQWGSNEKLRRKVEGFLWGILERRGGAINSSGWYNITEDELNELRAIIQKYKEPQQEANLAKLFEMIVQV